MVQTKSFIGSRKQTALDRALTSIEQKFQSDTGPPIDGLGAWAEKTPVILDGRPFSFHRHEYLITPYADNHPCVKNGVVPRYHSEI